MSPPDEKIGEYSVLRQLGSGGMAVVYLVRGPGGRVHALKAMRPQKEAKREMTRRFKAEFEVAGSLSHRNIVAVRDFFAADSTFHIVMEYVDGLDLRSVLKWGGALDDGRLALLGADIAAGLACAHATGVLHRDLKPENVMLGRRGHVKVTDFGVARVQGTRLTATGIIVGSPAYMSPEQLAGVPGQKLTPEADVYSFGALLYELGEGRGPLHFKKHEDLLTVLRAKREKKPRKMRRTRDPDLQELILSCLAAEPVDRPEAMSDLSMRLRRVARKHGASRGGLQHLMEYALDRRDAGVKANNAPAPLPAEAEEPAPAPSRPGVVSRLPAAAAAGAGRAVPERAPWSNPRPSAQGWEAPLLPPSIEGPRPRPPKAPPPRSRRPAGTVRPQEPRSKAGWARSEGRETSDIEDWGGSTPSLGRTSELSVERPGAEYERAGVVAWLALLMFGGAVLFLGASASLTGSPLGLLEQWIQLP
jgi:serine/threonine-protein kinase